MKQVLCEGLTSHNVSKADQSSSLWRNHAAVNVLRVFSPHNHAEKSEFWDILLGLSLWFNCKDISILSRFSYVP